MTDAVYWHSCDRRLTRADVEVGLHAGSREQAVMRRPHGILHRITLKPSARVTRMRDEGSWNRSRILAAARRAHVAIYLNRYEGIAIEHLETAAMHDASPDDRFRRHVPSARESIIILDPDAIDSIEIEEAHPPTQETSR